MKPFRVEYSLRPVKTAFHGELVSNNEIFISHDRQVANTGITEFFLFSLFLTKVKDSTMNQPLDVLRSRFYIASQSLSYLRHLKHIAHQRKILVTRTGENKRHTHKQ